MPSLAPEVQKTYDALGPLDPSQIYDDSELVAYKNGDAYIGQMDDNKKHGYGKVIFSNGTIFEGSFERNKAYGRGRMIYIDGSYYLGEYQ